MRITGLAVAVILGIILAIGVSGAGKAVPKPTPPPIVSHNGLFGLRDVYVQTHVAGDEKWRDLIGTTQDQLKADVEARLRGIAGLRVSQERSENTPRLIVHLVGHVIIGFEEPDPPAASHLTVGLVQPVSLRRPGPAGQQILASGITTTSTVLLTGKASTMRQRVRDKLAEQLAEFEQDYRRANQ